MEKYDEIRISGLEVYAFHGVFPKETKRGQNFRVNAVLYTNIRSAGISDALDNTVNYAEVCEYITDWMTSHTCKLLEAVAERLAQDILLRYDTVKGLDLEICKPEAPIPYPFDCVSVKISRFWHKAYLAVGSNIEYRDKHIERGIDFLKLIPGVRVLKVSSMIETKPYGVTEQPDFLNGCLEIDTLLDPEELLKELHRIESLENRVRTIHWGPRTLDLDIIFYDDLVYSSEDLFIPHVDCANRSFVLDPLNEIAPYYMHPVLRKTVAQLKEELDSENSRK